MKRPVSIDRKSYRPSSQKMLKGEALVRCRRSELRTHSVPTLHRRSTICPVPRRKFKHHSSIQRSSSEQWRGHLSRPNFSSHQTRCAMTSIHDLAERITRLLVPSHWRADELVRYALNFRGHRKFGNIHILRESRYGRFT